MTFYYCFLAFFCSIVEKEIGLFAHLCRQRNGAAKVFPHCGEKGFAFSRRVQGFKLSEASLKALKRG